MSYCLRTSSHLTPSNKSPFTKGGLLGIPPFNFRWEQGGVVEKEFEKVKMSRITYLRIVSPENLKLSSNLKSTGKCFKSFFFSSKAKFA